MPSFNKNGSQKLKEFLHNSCFHDANVESIRYDCRVGKLVIEAFNPIFSVRINLTFCDVKIALAIKGDFLGDRETILSLTAEEDYSYLHKYLLKNEEIIEECVYLLFQMFSGDELHVLSEEVIIEIS